MITVKTIANKLRQSLNMHPADDEFIQALNSVYGWRGSVGRTLESLLRQVLVDIECEERRNKRDADNVIDERARDMLVDHSRRLGELRRDLTIQKEDTLAAVQGLRERLAKLEKKETPNAGEWRAHPSGQVIFTAHPELLCGSALYASGKYVDGCLESFDWSQVVAYRVNP